MSAFQGKQYGLIIPRKSASKSAPLSRPSIFGDDSDDETSVGESLQKEAIKKKMMKQTRLEMQKALEEDSSVYDYDGVYDDIQKQRLESNKKLLGGTDRKPKYIGQLKRAIEERNKEKERREDRKIQKEREAEGEKFSDKEAYVTSAYREKLKERQEELERERRAAEIEAALDVKKQKDLSGFYRHFLNQTVGEEPLPERSADRQDDKADKKSRQDDKADKKSRQDDKADKKTRQEDKHSHQKEDRDSLQKENREKDRHRERDGERGRDRRDRDKDRETEDRHSKRNREDGDQDRHRDREYPKNDDKKEREKGQGDEKEQDKDTQDTQVHQDKDTQAENDTQAKAAQEPSKFAKRSNEQTVSSARERYLARQMARSAVKTYVEKEDE